MTKITIIGNPGKHHNVKKIEISIRKYLEKFGLSPKRLYFIFVKNARQLGSIYRKSKKGMESLAWKEILRLAKVSFAQMGTLAYISKKNRKEGVPPIILARVKGKILDEKLSHEVGHMKEDEEGWDEIKGEALGLLARDSILFLEEGEGPVFFSQLCNVFFDVFANEMMCQYGLNDCVFKINQESLKNWIKETPSRKERAENLPNLRLYQLYQIMLAAFWSSLPPSYSNRKEGEQKLEKMIIDYIRKISMEEEYRRIKLILSKLKIPPEKNNIYQCGAEIIELAREFLEK